MIFFERENKFKVVQILIAWLGAKSDHIFGGLGRIELCDVGGCTVTCYVLVGSAWPRDILNHF